MIKVNMHEAKTRLSQLVDAVEKNEDAITICRRGKPVAMIVRFAPAADRLTPDPALRVTLRYDPIEPLSEDEMPREYR
jgi:prevent-host-death family protein